MVACAGALGWLWFFFNLPETRGLALVSIRRRKKKRTRFSKTKTRETFAKTGSGQSSEKTLSVCGCLSPFVVVLAIAVCLLYVGGDSAAVCAAGRPPSAGDGGSRRRRRRGAQADTCRSDLNTHIWIIVESRVCV